jgi:hypothetical protein
MLLLCAHYASVGRHRQWFSLRSSPPCCHGVVARGFFLHQPLFSAILIKDYT